MLTRVWVDFEKRVDDIIGVIQARLGDTVFCLHLVRVI